MAGRWYIDAPPEIVLGEPLVVRVSAPAQGPRPLDWIGLYPLAVPTVPGASHGRWRYIHGHSDAVSVASDDVASMARDLSDDDVDNDVNGDEANGYGGSRGRARRRARDASVGRTTTTNGGDTTAPTTAVPTHTVQIEFPARMMPSHAGEFELRVHETNGYAAAMATRRLTVLPGKTHRGRRLVLFAALTAAVWWSQTLLDAKGTCAWSDPDTHPDPIDDLAVRATYGLNAWFAANPESAAAAQAVASMLLDLGMPWFLYVGAVKRSSMKPFLAIFLGMAMRFIAQAAAVIPCAPGFLWPAGEIAGVRIPTMLVDYHPANDFFFSGHVASTCIVGLQLWDMEYTVAAALAILVVMPLEAVLVIAFRAHRGIDVLTGIIAAIAACAIAERLANPVDYLIMELKATSEHQHSLDAAVAAADARAASAASRSRHRRGQAVRANGRTKRRTSRGDT